MKTASGTYGHIWSPNDKQDLEFEVDWTLASGELKAVSVRLKTTKHCGMSTSLRTFWVAEFEKQVLYTDAFQRVLQEFVNEAVPS